MTKIPSGDFGLAQAPRSSSLRQEALPARNKRRGDVVSKNRSAGRKDIPSLGKRKISSFRAKPGAFQAGQG